MILLRPPRGFHELDTEAPISVMTLKGGTVANTNFATYAPYIDVTLASDGSFGMSMYGAEPVISESTFSGGMCELKLVSDCTVTPAQNTLYIDGGSFMSVTDTEHPEGFGQYEAVGSQSGGGITAISITNVKLTASKSGSFG